MLNIPVQSADKSGEFGFQLGKFDGMTNDTEAAAITFKDVKVEVNGYRAKAALIDDGDFTATGTSGDLVFDFGTQPNIIGLDTVRLDAKGYTEAVGINVEDHQITELSSQAPPLISEMALAEFGRDVVLTFQTDQEYAADINGVALNGQNLTKGTDYTVTNNSITLDSSLFTQPAGKDRAVYDIVVHAEFYDDNHVCQLVYKQGLFTSTWSDEFNGTSLGPGKWGYQDGTGAEYGLDGWGNNEQQYYTRDNLTVEDGTLTITATEGKHGSKPYDSARIWTMSDDGSQVKFSQTYGHFEAKMQLPAGAGIPLPPRTPSAVRSWR